MLCPVKSLGGPEINSFTSYNYWGALFTTLLLEKQPPTCTLLVVINLAAVFQLTFCWSCFPLAAMAFFASSYLICDKRKSILAVHHTSFYASSSTTGTCNVTKWHAMNADAMTFNQQYLGYPAHCKTKRSTGNLRNQKETRKNEKNRKQSDYVQFNTTSLNTFRFVTTCM